MDQEKSAEETQHLEAFGPKLGPIFHLIHVEVRLLHAKWQEYLKLYAHSQERVDLLNDTAGFFFSVVQDLLWKDTLLHISRLTDPVKSSGHENLTIRRLPQLVNDSQLKKELGGLVDHAGQCSDFARQWRNRRLAHCDLQLTLDSNAMIMPPVSRENIEGVLKSFRDVMKLLDDFYSNGALTYLYTLTNRGAEQLVYHLEASTKAEQAQRQRFQRNEPLLGDL